MAERKITYDRVEHKMDSGFLVKAPSVSRLYIDAALALTDMMASLDTIGDTEHRKINVSGDTREALMVKWLTEVLFLFEKHKFLCKRITFEKFDGKNISASLSGENYVPTKHGAISEIKAVTSRQMEIGDALTPEPHFFARIFLDL